MKWEPIETAPVNTPVLVYYYKKQAKGGNAVGWFITEASLLPRKEDVYNYPSGPYIYISGNCWMDYAGRLLADMKAKNPQNFVTHWMPLPEKPEEDDSL